MFWHIFSIPDTNSDTQIRVAADTEYWSDYQPRTIPLKREV